MMWPRLCRFLILILVHMIEGRYIGVLMKRSSVSICAVIVHQPILSIYLRMPTNTGFQRRLSGIDYQLHIRKYG